MTERLYYTDAALREFTAQVVEIKETDRGPAVRLDRTAFYPTSGGQPYDIGLLGGVAVVETWEDDAGEIWHLLSSALSQTGEVTGVIDDARRFDHMQQHTGQHLLSEAFIRQLDAPTVSFHLGRDAVTIDLALAQLSWEAAFAVEDEVNRIVWEDRPVTVRLVAPEEVSTLALRKVPPISGPLRVVTVEDYDSTACGGTHVARTGAIGMVKVTGLERYKGGVRVAFLCGARALRDYRRTLRLLGEVSAGLTVGQDEVPAAVSRLQGEAQETRRALSRAQAALIDAEADRFWAESPEVQGGRRVVACWTGRPFAEVQTMAARLREHPRTLILLATLEGPAARLLFARSDDWAVVDAAALLKALLAKWGGRGGGSATMAQGGIPEIAPEALLAALQAVEV